MAENIDHTINRKRITLDSVFKELDYTAETGLPNPTKIRFFYVPFSSHKFSYETLQEYLYRNLSRYVFSRAKLEDYRQNEELDVAVAQALRVLSESEEGAGDVLDEMLIYTFLEEKLNAPKLMSHVELHTDIAGFKSECKGIHLLSPDGLQENTKFKMVFAASDIKNDIMDAINEAFETVLRINAHEHKEVSMVQKVVLDRLFDPAEIEVLKQSIIPTQNTAASFDTAYGIFLGYSLGVNTQRGMEFENIALKKWC